MNRIVRWLGNAKLEVPVVRLREDVLPLTLLSVGLVIQPTAGVSSCRWLHHLLPAHTGRAPDVAGELCALALL